MTSDSSSQPVDGAARATLLVFTLDAGAERARRRLLPGRLAAWEMALYRDCLDAALAAGRASGCRLAVSAPRRLRPAADVEPLPQEGTGFGDRLRRAVALRPPSAERPLVVVGADAPGIEPVHVRRALAALAARPDRLVAGPSPDGGFYLLAAARPIDELLAEVGWRRRDTLASLRAAARARGIEVELLEPLADLDRAADLAGWLASPAAALRPWARALAALLRRLSRPLQPLSLGRPLAGRPALVAARGPPG